MTEETVPFDLAATLIFIVTTFGPFETTVDDYLDGLKATDGDWNLIIEPSTDGKALLIRTEPAVDLDGVLT